MSDASDTRFGKGDKYIYSVKQYTWTPPESGGYIDELVQTSQNLGPTLIDDCSRHFYALQDANFNVLGVTTHGGKLVERYEYTPYGRRDVYSLGYLRADFDFDGDVDTFDYGIWQSGFGMTEGATAADGDADGDGDVDAFDDSIRQTESGSTLALNDELVMHPRAMSFRHAVTGIAVCEFGHQGLMHDEATGSRDGMIYNRARMLQPRLGRFVQRDPVEFVDGLNVYQYMRSHPGNLDPFGLFLLKACTNWVPVPQASVWWKKESEWAFVKYKVKVPLPGAKGAVAVLDLIQEALDQAQCSPTHVARKPLNFLTQRDRSNFFIGYGIGVLYGCECHWEGYQEHERTCCSRLTGATWRETDDRLVDRKKTCGFIHISGGAFGQAECACPRP